MPPRNQQQDPTPESQADKAPTTGQTLDAGSYYIVAAGASYNPADGGLPLLGLRGRVVQLADDEAQRLIGLGAVRAATDDEVRVERAVREQEASIAMLGVLDQGPAENPYGGTPLKGLQEHAAEEIKRAREAASK